MVRDAKVPWEAEQLLSLKPDAPGFTWPGWSL